MPVRPNIDTSTDSVTDLAETTNAILATIGDRGVIASFAVALTTDLSDFESIEVEGDKNNWEQTVDGPDAQTRYHKTGVITPGSAGTGTRFTWYDVVGNQFVLSRQTINPLQVGAVGDNVADDTAIFNEIEASSLDWIYLPEGYIFSTTLASVAKTYFGPGQINLNGTLTSYDYFGPDKALTARSFSLDNLKAIINYLETGAGVSGGTGVAGIEVERGSLANAELVFDENDQKWKTSTDGGVTRTPIVTSLTGQSILRNYIDGFKTDNFPTDLEHDIRIYAGAAADSSNSFLIDSNSVIVKQIDANWAEGSTLGGFPSGLTLAADTWYRVFVISKDDGTVDAGFDTSATAFNLLADATGYTYYRRIGWVRTDASANITSFRQSNDAFYFKTPKLFDISNPASGFSNVTTGAPPEVLALYYFKCDTAGGGGITRGYAWGHTSDDLNLAGFGSGHSAYMTSSRGDVNEDNGQFGSAKAEVETDSNSQIQIYKEANNLYGHLQGWIDYRGKE